jgi:thiamine monophosphate kinase
VGEDYVLLGTVPAPSAAKLEETLKANGCGLHPIGKTVSEPGLKLKAVDGSTVELAPRGWDHFK